MANTNFIQAPKLEHDGEKFNNNNSFYEIPQELADIVFNDTRLARSPAMLKIMLVLVGTKPGFGLSESWVCERTGLAHSSYSTARAALVNMGWITHIPSCGLARPGKLIVNFDAIYGRQEKEWTF